MIKNLISNNTMFHLETKSNLFIRRKEKHPAVIIILCKSNIFFLQKKKVDLFFGQKKFLKTIHAYLLSYKYQLNN